jgi:3-deoxy-D-manno-octulosonic acid kinase
VAVTPPAGFEQVRAGTTTWVLRVQARAWLLPLLHASASGWQGYARRPLAGGRGGSFAVSVGGHDVVVRPYRRGGLPARLWRDTYWGWRPRPFRELAVTEALRAHGAPVVAADAAGVRWLGPACYCGWLVTRYVHGARTLWEWASAHPAPAGERAAVLCAVGTAIRRLHAAGGRHPDLNLNNILIVPSAGGGPDVRFIDFDRAAIGARPAAPRADLARLRRSARKLDPGARWLTAADLDGLEAAYRSAVVPARSLR